MELVWKTCGHRPKGGRRRSDEAYLDGLGAKRTPDPTTAGDFCRRFEEHDVRTLLEVFDETRLQVWQRQSPEFFAEARIDMDGTLVETGAEKKQGIDIAYNGVWGYHPLVVSLANTGEVLSVVNRSGNRPSYEGAAAEVDRAIALCRRGGFRHIRLRGDTDFTQTTHLDRWDAAGDVTFVFGMDARVPLQIQADELPDSVWKRLRRPARYKVQTKRRRKRAKVKERIVKKRKFENLKLVSEDVAEMEYRPVACRQTYRLIKVSCSRTTATSFISPTTARRLLHRSCSRPMIVAIRRTSTPNSREVFVR